MSNLVTLSGYSALAKNGDVPKTEVIEWPETAVLVFHHKETGREVFTFIRRVGDKFIRERTELYENLQYQSFQITKTEWTLEDCADYVLFTRDKKLTTPEEIKEANRAFMDVFLSLNFHITS